MKLTYRGHTYESAPVQPSLTLDQSKIKLIYRGQTYYTSLRSVAVYEAIELNEKTVTLTYRGYTYKRKLQLSNLDQRLHSINWRYQASAEG
jgi:hypothetical protein